MSAPEAFEKARAKFLNGKELSRAHRDQILQVKNIDDVYDETDRLQKEQAKSRSLRYLGKIKPFLDCLQQYSEVVETFVTVNPGILALIWGPIKLLLKMSSIYTRSFEKLVDVFTRIGDCLPQFSRYAERFQGNNELHHVLALFFEDILDVYLATYKFVSGHVRPVLVEFLWPNLDGKLELIRSNINRHKELFTHEVTLNVIIDAQHARTEALEHYEKDRKFETDQKMHDFMSFLSPTLYEGKIERIKEKRCNDTGSWIKRERPFKRWLDPTDQSASLLWLTGIPGAGKSFLSWDIITWLQDGYQGVNITASVVYAFISYSEQAKNPLLSAVHSFIYQIVLKNSDVLPMLLGHYAQLKKLRDNQEYAVSVLKELLDHAGDVYMLVDGLDECNERYRRKLLPTLLELRNKCSNLRILISSQIEADISELLKKTAAVIQIGDNNHADIDSYVKTQSIALLDSFEVGHSTNQGREIIAMLDQISKKAEGMIIQLRYDSINLPTGLSEAYGRIMKRIMNHSKPSEKSHVHRLFQWLCSAKRPIREIELHHALLIRPGDRDLEYHGPRKGWLDICGPIIETRGDTVDFVHFSAKGCVQPRP
ncbi:hypothetical protein K440DRAFT_560364 [Wilcoxina mikolae CBS 423.85]|nr:hypothetical protein K440DRAFT_560364 [Wilcoxina mikolae CBS 423.85]